MRDPTQTRGTMPHPPKPDHPQLYEWGGPAVVMLIALGLSWEMGLHHFAVELLIALIVLLVLMALFEGTWRGVVHALRRLGFEMER